MSRKEKLLQRLCSRPKDFTWDEAVAVMEAHGFKLLKSPGSGRKFFHVESKIKVFIHEPHPSKIVKGYALEELIQGLQNANEIQ